MAIEFAERFSTDSARIDDGLVSRLREHFDDGEVVELTLVIAKYLAFGRFMQVLDLDQACACTSTRRRRRHRVVAPGCRRPTQIGEEVAQRVVEYVGPLPLEEVAGAGDDEGSDAVR